MWCNRLAVAKELQKDELYLGEAEDFRWRRDTGNLEMIPCLTNPCLSQSFNEKVIVELNLSGWRQILWCGLIFIAFFVY
jgi:hypothetical protein